MENSEDIAGIPKFVRKISIGNIELDLYTFDGRNLLMSSDVVDKLGYENINKMIRLIEDDNKIKLHKKVSNYLYVTWYIDEIGLMDLIFKSRRRSISNLKKLIPELITSLKQ